MKAKGVPKMFHELLIVKKLFKKTVIIRNLPDEISAHLRILCPGSLQIKFIGEGVTFRTKTIVPIKCV